MGIEVFRQPALGAAHEFGGFFGEFGLILCKQRVPFVFQSRTFCFRVPLAVNFLRHFKRGVMPAQMRARGGDFVRAQRCAVHFVAAFFVCRAFAD